MGYPLVPGYESVGRVVAAGPTRAAPASANASSCPARAATARCAACSAARPRRIVVAGRARRAGRDDARRTGRAAGPGRHGVPRRSGGGKRDPHRAARPDRRPRRARPPARAHDRGGRLRAAHGLGDQRRARRAARRATPWSTRRRRPARDYRAIYDVSGDAQILDRLIARLAPGGEIVLAGFYTEPLSLHFRAGLHARGADPRAPPSGSRADLLAVTRTGRDRAPVARRPDHAPRPTPTHADAAYRTAFGDPGLPEDGPRLEKLSMSTHR